MIKRHKFFSQALISCCVLDKIESHSIAPNKTNENSTNISFMYSIWLKIESQIWLECVVQKMVFEACMWVDPAQMKKLFF